MDSFAQASSPGVKKQTFFERLKCSLGSFFFNPHNHPPFYTVRPQRFQEVKMVCPGHIVHNSEAEFEPSPARMFSTLFTLALLSPESGDPLASNYDEF